MGAKGVPTLRNRRGLQTQRGGARSPYTSKFIMEYKAYIKKQIYLNLSRGVKRQKHRETVLSVARRARVCFWNLPRKPLHLPGTPLAPHQDSSPGLRASWAISFLLMPLGTS